MKRVCMTGRAWSIDGKVTNGPVQKRDAAVVNELADELKAIAGSPGTETVLKTWSVSLDSAKRQGQRS